MEENNPYHFPKKGVKTILLALLSIFVAVLIVSEIADIKNKLKNDKTITFTGEGKVTGIPDVASINLSVVTDKMTAKEAMEENAQKMNEIIKFIKDSGVDEKDVKTTAYYLSPRYDWLEGKRVFRGYELTSSLAVKIRNLQKISEIIDGAVGKGANQVGDVQFVIDDQEKLKTEARNEAIANAKERAESIAAAAGLKLGKIVNFSESGTVPPSPIYYLEKEVGTGGAAPAPELEKGSQEIIIDVSLTFELK